jgi:hypothetical protein
MATRNTFCIATAFVLMSCTATWAQSRLERAATTAPTAPTATSANPYAGKWTYRSYLNQPGVIVGSDPQKALDMIFGEGVMTFDLPVGNALKGTFDMGGGYILDLTGSVQGNPSSAPPVIQLSGIGRPGTPTDGWEYDYIGYLAWAWPNGVAQIPAIVGTVVRAKQHGQSQAGLVASFITTKQP